MLALNAGTRRLTTRKVYIFIAVAVLRPPQALLMLSLAVSAVLVASTSALDAAYAPAKLQWQTKTRDATVLLLTETEGARQTAQAMWPVGAAIEALLNDVDAQNVICCLPFATGKDCATFGLRRYEKGEAWALGSAANVGSCRAAAEALDGNRDGGAFSLRCAELAVDADVDNGVLSLAGFASEAASKPENVEAVASVLGLAEGQVAYAAATPGDTLVVEVEDENALAAAEATLMLPVRSRDAHL